jgi:coenzyme F420-reducing hydrogenase delta subunit
MNNETSIYLELISECHRIAGNIRNKARVIIVQTICEETPEAPTRTELEKHLHQLVKMLDELERDIVT